MRRGGCGQFGLRGALQIICAWQCCALNDPFIFAEALERLRPFHLRSVLWDLSPHFGFGMGARFMDTIAWTHLIR